MTAPSAAPGNQDRGGTHHVEFVMGMAVSLDIRDSDTPSDAVADVVTWLHHVDATFSTYIDDSPISRLGRGELDLDDVTDEVRDVLRLCEQMRLDTDGAFDIFEVPAPNGTTLDPSGLVKGWSIELAARILEHSGCANFCINAGGDIALRGRPAVGEPWRVGIRHPDQIDRLATVVAAPGPLAVATSATYERGAHIIDPRTGRPTTELASVTVVGPDLTIADAYATAVFVMGLDGLDWISGRPDYDAYVITHDAVTTWTPGFARYRSDTERDRIERIP
jgi:thiamine biosynthesis lipoprotein